MLPDTNTVYAYLAAVRTHAPKIHMLTNTAAVALSANALLAVGAEPSATEDAAAQPAFVDSADGLLVNLGMIDAPKAQAVTAAAKAASARELAWVLDPVMVHRDPARLELSRRLLRYAPAIVRGNAAEIGVLRPSGMVVACSGVHDRITMGTQSVYVHNGTPLFARTTAMGCVLGALCAAFAAVAPPDTISDAGSASVAAHTVFAVSGEMAAAEARGPGSFVVALWDCLAGLQASDLAARARVSGAAVAERSMVS